MPLRITDLSKDLPLLNQQLARIDALEAQLKQFQTNLKYAQSKIRTARTLVGSLAANTTKLVFVTWTPPFDDIKYTLNAIVNAPSGFVEVQGEYHDKAPGSALVLVKNTSGSTAFADAVLNVIAIHD